MDLNDLLEGSKNSASSLYLVGYLVYFLVMKMEAVLSFEASVNFNRAIRCHIQEDEVFTVTAARISDPTLCILSRNTLYHEGSQEKLIFHVFRTSALRSGLNKQITGTVYISTVSFLLYFDYDLCVLMFRDTVSFTIVII